VVDAFEHAYLADYGTKKGDYIEVVMKLANWEVVNRRFKKART